MRNSLIPAPYNWADAKTEDKTRPAGYVKDSRRHKQDQLRSSLDTNHYELPRRVDPVAQPPASSAKERKLREFGVAQCEVETSPPVLTYRLSGLHANATEWQVRKLLEGVHIVRVEMDLDNITGKCRGTAQVQVRSHVQSAELQTAKTEAAGIGWEMQLYTPEVRRRTQYADLTGKNFLDPGTEQMRTEYEAPKDADQHWREGTEDLYRWTQLRKS